MEGSLIEDCGTYIASGAEMIQSIKYLGDHCYQGHEITVKAIEVEPETVGQFAGHITKDNVKVFEGDIVRDGYGQVALVRIGQGTQEGHLGTGGFYCAYLCVRSKYGGYEQLNRMNFFGIKVIGNVHDAPELLGGAK